MFRIVVTFTAEFASTTGVQTITRDYYVAGFPQNAHDAALAQILDFTEATATDVESVSITRV